MIKKLQRDFFFLISKGDDLLLQPHAPSCSTHTSNVTTRTRTTFSDTNTNPFPTCAKDASDADLSPAPFRSSDRDALTEQLDEAAVAVRFVVLFFEGAFVELLQAEGADEVLRVELLGHGGDAASRDGFLAAGAEGAAALVVVHFTVRLTVVLEEAPIHKRGETLPANKTLGMPKAAQR